MNERVFADEDCRRHCETAGRDYEEYRPAYLMGWQLGAGGRFSAWEAAEPHVRRLWNDQQFGRPWTAKEATETWACACASARWAFDHAHTRRPSKIEPHAL